MEACSKRKLSAGGATDRSQRKGSGGEEACLRAFSSAKGKKGWKRTVVEERPLQRKGHWKLSRRERSQKSQEKTLSAKVPFYALITCGGGGVSSPRVGLPE